MTTIKDLVKETGLSLGTISKYLNGLPVKEVNRLKIEQAIEKLGYSYNDLGRSLKTSRSGLIGILIPSLREPFSAEIITAAETVFRSEYGALVCDTLYSPAFERETIELFLRKRVDGVIAVPTADDGGAYARLNEASVPLVLIDKQLKGVSADVFLLDNFTVSRQVGHRIADAGHRKVGILCAREGLQSAGERLEGFAAGLKDRGVSLPSELVVRADYAIPGQAQKAAEALLTRSPTAVFASNYDFTVALIAAKNREKASFSYVGFDDLGFTDLVRPIPSLVTQPMADYGRAAARKLLSRLAGDLSPCQTERFPGTFKQGDSLT